MTFEAGLCRMQNNALAGPYATATIEAETVAHAVKKAKRWTKTVDILDKSWLQVLRASDRFAVASLKPGEF